MLNGNLTPGINDKLDELAEIDAAYSDLRNKGLDLYRVGSYRMIALPDEERTPAKREGLLHMTKSDWQKYSKLVKTECVNYELKQKSNFFNLYKTDEELMRAGMERAWRILESETANGRLIRPLNSFRGLKLFSAESIREAIEGNAPKIDYLDIDLC